MDIFFHKETDYPHRIPLNYLGKQRGRRMTLLVEWVHISSRNDPNTNPNPNHEKKNPNTLTLSLTLTEIYGHS